MDQADVCPSLRRLEGDRYRRSSRWQVLGALPAPGEDDPFAGLDLGDGARGRVSGRDGPPVLPARPQLDAGSDRLPASQPFRLGQKGEGLVRGERHQHRLLCAHGMVSFFGGSGGGELFELMGPEHVEGVAERGHARWVEPVVAEPPGLASLNEPCIRQHPQMLRDGRPRDAELDCELAYRLLARREQLEESPPVGFGKDRHEIGHAITLAETNTLCTRLRKGQFETSRGGGARHPSSFCQQAHEEAVGGADVEAVRRDVAGGTSRDRVGGSSVPPAGGLRPSARAGHLLLPSPRLAVNDAHRANSPGGADGHRRRGGVLARRSSRRGLATKRAVPEDRCRIRRASRTGASGKWCSP